MSGVHFRSKPSAGVKYWLPPVLISLLLRWISTNPISNVQMLCATAMLIIPWVAYFRWQRRGETRVPLFAIIAMAYWAAFAFPLFLSDPPADPVFGMVFDEATIDSSMLLGVLGVVALGIGMKIPFRPLKASAMPDVVDSEGSWKYLYCVLAGGGILSLHQAYTQALGTGGRMILVILATSVPLTICAMLAIKRLDGTATHGNKLALLIFLVGRGVAGIASGWLGSVVTLCLILGFVYTSERRRIPARILMILIPLILFLQSGKMAFRDAYWRGGKTGTNWEKAKFWVDASWKQWSGAFEGNKGTHQKDRRALFQETVDRVAILPQTANVISKSPRMVPFQNGSSYTFLLATLIPRLVWPTKPSVNDANRTYQVAYGITSKDDLEGVSISVGCLTESFMNFGWRGVVPVMVALGLIVGVFERTLLSWNSGLLFSSIGMALLFNLISVEAQAAQYLGGLLQQIALIFVLATPVIRRRKDQRVAQFQFGQAV